MSIKILYIISMLFVYIPRFIERISLTNRLCKEKYSFTNKRDEIVDNISSVLGAIISSVVPGLNIYLGIKTIQRLRNFDETYSYYKLSLLIDGSIKKNVEQTVVEEYVELLFSTLNIVCDIPEKSKAIYELLSNIDYLETIGYPLEEELKNTSPKYRQSFINDIARELREKNAPIDDLVSKVLDAGCQLDSHFYEWDNEKKTEYLKKLEEEITARKTEKEKAVIQNSEPVEVVEDKPLVRKLK